MDKEFFESLKICFENQTKLITGLLQEKSSKSNSIERLVPQFPQLSKDDNWESYNMRLKQHFIAYNVTSDDQKRAYFLSWVGSETFILLQKLFGLSDVGTQTYSDILDTLTNYFKSNTHVLASRYKFLKTDMKPHQSYTEWVAELRGIARDCQFVCPKDSCNQSTVDSCIRDVIVLLTPHEYVRSQALQLANPSLQEVLKIASTFETTQAARKVICDGSEPEVFTLSSSNQASRQLYHSSPQKSSSRSFNTHRPTPLRRRNSDCSPESVTSFGRHDFDVPEFRKSCPTCFKTHQRRFCRFYKSTCDSCGKLGHMSKVCCSKSKVEVDFLDEVQTISLPITESNLRYHINVTINGKHLQMTLDSGATCSMIGPETYKRLGSPVLHPPSSYLKAYGGVNIPLKGWFLAKVKVKSQTKFLRLLVTNISGGANIFGTPWFHAFNISISAPGAEEINTLSSKEYTEPSVQKRLDEIKKENASIFEPGLGTCTTFQAAFHLKDNARPRFFKPRPIPFSQYDTVKLEIERLQSLGIIKPIKASQWAAPMVVVSKPNGKVRLCGDFKVTINPQIDIDRYPLPRFEELLQKLKGGKRFSKIDLADAYLQLELNEEAKRLAVINTPFGLFQYQRLAFGIASAPAIFQCFLEQVISGIPGCVNYLDDILVTGSTTEEHLNNLSILFAQLKENGLRCNLSKCAFFKRDIEYLGNTLTEDGVQPSDSKVEALKRLPHPTNHSELQTFIGKMTYYHRFIPNFATISAPLNRLRRKHVEFCWGEEEEKAFQQLKNALIDVTRLVPYHSEFPLILATDASSYGVGAALSTRYPDGSERPIAFASKTLNDTEKRYSQIEKEALSIIFGVKKFHQYVYGRSFELITDHKPLVSLFHPDKKLPVYTLARLQRWAITLTSYNFTIRYRPTEKHGNADALSRLPMGPDLEFDQSEDCCNWVTDDQTEQLNSFPITSKIVAQETSKDSVLSKVLSYVLNGWPDTLPSSDLKPYFDRRYALTAQSGVLILQCEHSRVLVPAKLQPSILDLLHSAHWGIVRMKQMARRYCWWFHIDHDIEKLTKSCNECQQVKPNPKQSYHSWPTPEKPWERVHIDFAGPFWGSTWFIVVDAYSKFPFVMKMSNITAESTVRSLNQIFLLEGPPETLVSDNGAQFTSSLFKNFCTQAGINHLTTAPFHPASNGEAERWVRTFKEAMKKAWLEGKNKSNALDVLLFTYRTMPNPRTGKTPAELLHGRQPRTSLSFLHPNILKPQSFQSKFMVHDQVYVKFFSGKVKWEPGTIIRHRGKMMYLVQTARGIVSRHQNQLRPLRSSQEATDKELSSLLAQYRKPDSDVLHNTVGEGDINGDRPTDNEVRPTDNEVVDHAEPQTPKRKVAFIIPSDSNPSTLRSSSRLRRPPLRYSP